VILKYISPPDSNISHLDQFVLYQNYPNPFNSKTIIGYNLAASGDITLIVYDVLGNEIVTLVDEYKSIGSYEIEFNVAQVSRPEIASGVYFYQLRVTGPETSSGHGLIQTKKMIYLK
jgi:hypothetical protein